MSDLTFQIRRATSNDEAVLVEFNCALALETEGKELNRATVTSGVRRGLQQGAEVAYFLAATDDQVIGSLMLTREWSDWRDGWLAWLQSVYVRPMFRNRGVFRALLSAAIQQARQDPDVIGLRLYVEAENQAAQAVYLRTGFRDPNYKVLEKIFDKPDS